MNGVVRWFAEGTRARGMRARDVVIGITTTLVLIVAWRFYERWRSGRVELVAVGEPVVVQVLDERTEEPVRERVGVVDRAVIELPAGEYKLRVEGKGTLSRTFRFSVNRGETLSHSISIDEGKLIGSGTEEEPREYGTARRRRVNPPITYAANTHAIELVPGRFDLVECSRTSVICRDGASGRVRWNTGHPLSPFDANRDLSRWLLALRPTDAMPGVLEPAADLDGDGLRDIVLYFKSDAAFVAISGRDGGMLWNHVPELDSPETDRIQRKLVGKPSMLDVDHDGTLDVVTTIAFSAQIKAGMTETMFRRSAMAISGRTGTRLWAFALDPGFTMAEDAGDECEATEVSFRKPQGDYTVGGPRATVIGFVTGTRWFGLNSAGSDVQFGPIDLGFWPQGAIQYADLDGDGAPEILAFERGSTDTTNVLHAIRVDSGRELWAEEIGSLADETRGFVSPFQTSILRESVVKWPIVADLDGDGGAEILVPDEGQLPGSAGYRGVRLLDGRRGSTRWRRPMRLESNNPDGMTHAEYAPDLDGDGTRDVIIVSRYLGRENIPRVRMAFVTAVPESVFVDALSGKDGHALWCWHVEYPSWKGLFIHAPFWWGRGPDGWPMLALPVGGSEATDLPVIGSFPFAEPVVHVIEASTGRERHSVRGLTRAAAADLDGDGIVDLWGEVDGELRAFRGEAPEAWRALGRFDAAGAVELVSEPVDFDVIAQPSRSMKETVGKRTIDFDGDGVTDVLVDWNDVHRARDEYAGGGRSAIVRSGRDGRMIWKTHIRPLGSWADPSVGDRHKLSAFPLPEGDMDGDGTPDVLVQKWPGRRRAQVRSLLDVQVEVLSGRTGGRLFSAPISGVSSVLPSPRDSRTVEPVVIEPNGKPDLIIRGQKNNRPTMMRVSGRNGALMWEAALVDEANDVSVLGEQNLIDDVDGDGVLDAMFVTSRDSSSDLDERILHVVSLGDGKPVWSQPVDVFEKSLGFSPICAGDLDGDGRPEVVLLEAVGGQEERSDEVRVRVLDGRDGKTRWTWKSGVSAESIVEGASIALAKFHGDKTREVCVGFCGPGERENEVGIVVLDRNGKERTRRRLGRGLRSQLRAVDLDGDGGDELLFVDGTLELGQLQAWRWDLKNLWKWPEPRDPTESPWMNMRELEAPRDVPVAIDRIIPALGRQRPAVVITSSTAAIDGPTGKPLWTGWQMGLAQSARVASRLLDAGDVSRPALSVASGEGWDATVCRVAVPLPRAGPGKMAAILGRGAKDRQIIDDPRWRRPLPWIPWCDRMFRSRLGVVFAGLASVNVILPGIILWLLFGRRRVFRMWALMVAPAVVVIPLLSYIKVVPSLPVSSERWLATGNRMFVVGTLAGVPIVFGAIVVAGTLARRKWRAIGAMAALVIVVTMVVAGAWIGIDRRSMAYLEHYAWEGAPLAFLAGAYTAAMVWGVGMLFLALRKLVRRQSTHSDGITG